MKKKFKKLFNLKKKILLFLEYLKEIMDVFKILESNHHNNEFVNLFDNFN